MVTIAMGPFINKSPAYGVLYAHKNRSERKLRLPISTQGITVLYFKSWRRKSVVLLSQIELTWRHGAEPGKQIFAIVKPQIYVLHVVSEKIIKNFSQSRDLYGPWQPCWITDRNNTWLDHANEHSATFGPICFSGSLEED